MGHLLGQCSAGKRRCRLPEAGKGVCTALSSICSPAAGMPSSGHAYWERAEQRMNASPGHALCTLDQRAGGVRHMPAVCRVARPLQAQAATR